MISSSQHLMSNNQTKIERKRIEQTETRRRDRTKTTVRKEREGNPSSNAMKNSDRSGQNKEREKHRYLVSISLKFSFQLTDLPLSFQQLGLSILSAQELLIKLENKNHINRYDKHTHNHSSTDV